MQNVFKCEYDCHCFAVADDTTLAAFLMIALHTVLRVASLCCSF